MIFEIIAEIFLELYMELMLLIVPDKNLVKWQISLAKAVAIAVMVIVFALFIWGLVLISDYEDPIGYLPITLAVIISLVQIILGILLYKKHHKD